MSFRGLFLPSPSLLEPWALYPLLSTLSSHPASFTPMAPNSLASIPTLGSTLPVPSHLLELPFDVPWTFQAYYIKSNPASFPASTLQGGSAHVEHPREATWVHVPKLRNLTFFLVLTPSVKSVTMSCLCCLLIQPYHAILTTALKCYSNFHSKLDLEMYWISALTW